MNEKKYNSRRERLYICIFQDINNVFTYGYRISYAPCDTLSMFGFSDNKN